jgi:hypothetical protein
MRVATTILCALLAVASAGCKDDTRPSTPPAAPRGLYSVTGDHQVTLHWMLNTESDVSGYRVYQASCSDGGNCPYDRVGSVGAGTSSFVVTGLTNGQTRFFAVAAYNHENREGDLSYQTVYDTPRPAGTGAQIHNFRGGQTAAVGWEFASATARSLSDTLADIIYSDTLGIAEMYAADVNTDIQDAGYATSLDYVDYAPDGGWSPSGSVELIPGHCYVVRTRDVHFDTHFAKFRITGLTHTVATFDWAYQTDPNNGELRAHRAGHGAASALQAVVTQR